MTSELQQAALLADWLDAVRGDDVRPEPPEGLTPDVVDVVSTLAPSRAPGPRLSVDDILFEVADGPLAEEVSPAELDALETLLRAGEVSSSLDGDVLDAVSTLRPEHAPGPRLTIDDVLAEVRTGPLAAQPMPSSIAETASSPAAPANRPPVRRARWLWPSLGGLAVAATTLLFVSPIAEQAMDAPPALQQERAHDVPQKAAPKTAIAATTESLREAEVGSPLDAAAPPQAGVTDGRLQTEMRSGRAAGSVVGAPPSPRSGPPVAAPPSPVAAAPAPPPEPESESVSSFSEPATASAPDPSPARAAPAASVPYAANVGSVADDFGSRGAAMSGAADVAMELEDAADAMVGGAPAPAQARQAPRAGKKKRSPRSRRERGVAAMADEASYGEPMPDSVAESAMDMAAEEEAGAAPPSAAESIETLREAAWRIPAPASTKSTHAPLWTAVLEARGAGDTTSEQSALEALLASPNSAVAVEAATDLARLHLRAGDRGLALAALARGLERSDAPPRARSRLYALTGEVLEQRGDIRGAAESYRRAVGRY